MKRHYFILIIFLVFLVGYNSQKKEEKSINLKPNIVIIVADDLGWNDVGFHGSDIKTPYLDELSLDGIILNRFYVAPICTPTRAGLLTGKYPNRFGVREVVIPPWRDFGIDPKEVFLPEELTKAGYKNSAIIGKWHLGHSNKEYYPLNQGFTHFYGHLNGAIDYFSHKREGELDWHDDWESSYDKGYATDLITDHAVKCIDEYSAQGPFFLYVAYNAPHIPLQAKDEDLELYGFYKNKPRFGNGKAGHGNTKKQTYAAMVTAMDRGIGKIRQMIENKGIAENTLFLFFSDNGPDSGHGGGSSTPLKGHKFTEFEGGVRVPALLSWPAKFESKRTIDQVTGFVDIMPTILDILKQNSNLELDGISMLPIFTGEKKRIDREIYLGSGAVVSTNWKFIEKGHNKRIKTDVDLLYKINEDPSEEKNLFHINKSKTLELKQFIKKYDTIKPAHRILPFNEGKDGFKAPKEWKVN